MAFRDFQAPSSDAAYTPPVNPTATPAPNPAPVASTPDPTAYVAPLTTSEMTRDFAFAATVSDVPVSLAATNALTLSEADFGKAFNGMVHDSAFMQRYDQQRQVDPAANAPELSKDSHFEANNAYEKAMAASYDASVKLQALGYTQQGKINVPPAEVQVAAQKLSAMGELGGAAVNPQQTTQLAQTINGLKPETAISSLQASPNSGIDS